MVSVATLDADVIIEDDRWRDGAAAEAVRRAANALAACVPKRLPEHAAVTILLSDDARMTALNAHFRHIAVPTNVLSFPAGPGATEPGAPIYLGDVILAAETVVREAAALGVPLLHHVQHLAVHGVLHLLGYDHIADVDAEVMEDLEIKILESLDVPNPYLQARLESEPTRISSHPGRGPKGSPRRP